MAVTWTTSRCSNWSSSILVLTCLYCPDLPQPDTSPVPAYDTSSSPSTPFQYLTPFSHVPPRPSPPAHYPPANQVPTTRRSTRNTMHVPTTPRSTRIPCDDSFCPRPLHLLAVSISSHFLMCLECPCDFSRVFR